MTAAQLSRKQTTIDSHTSVYHYFERTSTISLVIIMIRNMFVRFNNSKLFSLNSILNSKTITGSN